MGFFEGVFFGMGFSVGIILGAISLVLMGVVGRYIAVWLEDMALR